MGVLLVHWKGGVTRAEKRAFVLYEDRLDYFLDLGVLTNGFSPKGRIPLSSIQSKEVDKQESCLDLNLVDGTLTLKTSGPDDLRAWEVAFSKALGEVLAEPTEPKERRPVCQSMMEAGGEMKLFVLHNDCLEFYISLTEMVKGASPQGRILIDEIHDVERTRTGFMIHLVEFKLKLCVHEQPDLLDAWANAWYKVLNMGSGSPEVSKETTCLTDSKTREWLKYNKLNIVHQGPLGMKHEGRLAKRHVILFHDRIEFFYCHEDEPRTFAMPVLSILLKEIRSLNNVGRGLVLNHQGHFLGLNANTEADSQAWSDRIDDTMTRASQPQSQARMAHAALLLKPKPRRRKCRPNGNKSTCSRQRSNIPASRSSSAASTPRKNSPAKRWRSNSPTRSRPESPRKVVGASGGAGACLPAQGLGPRLEQRGPPVRARAYAGRSLSPQGSRPRPEPARPVAKQAPGALLSARESRPKPAPPPAAKRAPGAMVVMRESASAAARTWPFPGQGFNR